MRRIICIFIVSLLASFSLTLLTDNLAYADNPIVTDVSWANCGEKLSNLTNLGIVGVNNGLDYSKNPCLADETLAFHNQYALYLNTGYPGASFGLKFARYPNNCRPSNSLCLAYNYGYNDAVDSLKYADNQNAHGFTWWLDVETDNSWTNHYQQNREALIGMLSALKKYTFMSSFWFLFISASVAINNWVLEKLLPSLGSYWLK
ncbi:MAG TPA: hypothetical protein VGF75_02305 [Candidatus Saccharimonadales bacterium]|jgi:hypothetical protein